MCVCACNDIVVALGNIICDLGSACGSFEAVKLLHEQLTLTVLLEYLVELCIKLLTNLLLCVALTAKLNVMGK